MRPPEMSAGREIQGSHQPTYDERGSNSDDKKNSYRRQHAGKSKWIVQSPIKRFTRNQKSNIRGVVEASKDGGTHIRQRMDDDWRQSREHQSWEEDVQDLQNEKA